MTYFQPKDLKTQLIEFAARKALSKVIDVAARHAERKITEEVRDRKLLKNLGNSARTQERKYHTMSFIPSNGFGPNAGTSALPANNSRGRRRDEPIELWVNIVIVDTDGADPVRILSGRPLNTFAADKDVTTNNVEFNKANAIHNAFVTIMNEDAAKLNLGEAKYYSPQGVEMVEKDGEMKPLLKAGIYLQLFRTEVDAAADAAAKQDIEAEAKESLRSLFG